MAHDILLIGATGTVGGATLQALSEAGVQPLALVRDPLRGERVIGDRALLRSGDLDNASSLSDVLEGVENVLLCSSHGPQMRGQQLAAVRAIEKSDVRRVVKISGSPVSMAAKVGHDHLDVEEALWAIGREVVVLRPNTFMQTFLAQAGMVSLGLLPGPEGDPKAAFIDARDVGRVAAAALRTGTPPEPVLELSGPMALTWSDVADAMSLVLGRTIAYFPASPDIARRALLDRGQSEWLVEHTLALGALMHEQKAAEVTDTVMRITGQPPIGISDFLNDHSGSFAVTTA